MAAASIAGTQRLWAVGMAPGWVALPLPRRVQTGSQGEGLAVGRECPGATPLPLQATPARSDRLRRKAPQVQQPLPAELGSAPTAHPALARPAPLELKSGVGATGRGSVPGRSASQPPPPRPQQAVPAARPAFHAGADARLPRTDLLRPLPGPPERPQFTRGLPARPAGRDRSAPVGPESSASPPTPRAPQDRAVRASPRSSGAGATTNPTCAREQPPPLRRRVRASASHPPARAPEGPGLTCGIHVRFFQQPTLHAAPMDVQAPPKCCGAG